MTDLSDGHHPWRSLDFQKSGEGSERWEQWQKTPLTTNPVLQKFLKTPRAVVNPKRREKLTPVRFGVQSGIGDWLRVIGGPQSGLTVLITDDGGGNLDFNRNGGLGKTPDWIGRWAGEPVAIVAESDAENDVDISDEIIIETLMATGGDWPWAALERDPTKRRLPDRAQPTTPPEVPIVSYEYHRNFIESYRPLGLYVGIPYPELFLE